MSTAELVAMSVPLKGSVLCLDCDSISTRQQDGRCPVCNSEAVMDLEAVLNRDAEEPRG